MATTFVTCLLVEESVQRVKQEAGDIPVSLTHYSFQ
jgi:hypothetical protein